MEEIWKPVRINEDYEVSNFGRVRSLRSYRRTRSGKLHIQERVHLLSPSDNGHGYKYFTVKTDSGLKRLYVHRIVAESFLDNPYGLPQVNHKDMDKANNCVDNLEWCNGQYNMDYSFARRVVQKDKATGDIVGIFKSVREASRQTGISNGNISLACNGVWHHCHGYIWEFI